MIVKVLREFYDKDNLKRLFKVGEQVDFADARAKNIVLRGLGEFVNTEAEKPVADEKPAVPVESEQEGQKPEVHVEEEKPAEIPVEEKKEEEVSEPQVPAKRRGRPARS